MKRRSKNLIMFIFIVILSILVFLTMNYSKKHLTTSAQTKQNTTMEKSDNSTSDSNSENSTSDSNSENNSSQNAPTGNNAPENNGNMQKPDSTGNSSGGGFPNETIVDSPSDNHHQLTFVYYFVFAAESLGLAMLIIYLLMSKFNRRTRTETFKNTDKIIIYLLSIILLTSVFTVSETYLTQKFFLTANAQTMTKPEENENSSDSTSVDATGANEIDGEDSTLSSTYTSSKSDENVILVKNSGNLTLKNASVTKKSGDSTNTENSEFYGINAGLLVTANSTATISGTKISTDASGSNAVFSTGDDSKIYISNSTITTNGDSSSRGLDATYGGYIKADNVKITTQGGSCATLATDRGEGTVITQNSTLETNGSGSPVIYSTGDISITDTIGTANGSQMVVIEGKNTATVTNSTLTASGSGNRNHVDDSGIMIYQSMSGDASEGTGTFTSTDSTLSISKDSDYYKTAPMFFVTNTDAKINLTNTKLNYGSNILLSVKGTSEWGTSNSNGGNVTLNSKKQDLTGSIELDKISTLTMNLTSSKYTGTINGDNTAKNISLKLDKKSSITLTGDSYVSSLKDKDSSYSNIDFNGYTLYVDGTAIN